MGSVTFYKAPIINETNRFRKSRIATYLSTCASVTYSVDDAEVQPNVPFYVKEFFAGIQDAAQYNYIGYENAGVACYALILDVSQVSSNLSEGLLFKIFHVIDAIATYGDGVFDDINGVYASGIMSRGHVNDWAWDGEKAVATNKNYLAAPEEIVNNANIRYTRFTPDQKYSPITVSTLYRDNLDGTKTGFVADFTIVGYLIIYVANHNTIEKSSDTDNASSCVIYTNRGEGGEVPIQGLCCVYGLGLRNGELYGLSRCNEGTVIRWQFFKINKLTNSGITAMCLLPLIWDPSTTLSFATGYLQSASKEAWEGGFPEYVEVMAQDINSVSFADEVNELGYFLKGAGIPSSTGLSYTSADLFNISISSGYSFKKYCSGVYSKLHTAPYFNIQIEDVSIISVFWDATYEYQAALDCSGFLIHSNWANTANDYSIISTTNLGMFAPAVVNDYWTRLNATQESILANIGQTQNVMGVVSSAINFASKGAQAVAGAATGGMTATGAVGTGGGIAGSGAGLIGSIATYGDKKEYYSNQQEIAQHQAQVGLTKDVAVMGVLQLQDSYVVPAVKCQYLTDDEIYRLARLIHEKGYVTNMPLQEVATHRRYNFNYIQSTNYNITGLPISVARELQDLFARGIHIWHYELIYNAGGTTIYEKYFNPPVELEEI